MHKRHVEAAAGEGDMHCDHEGGVLGPSTRCSASAQCRHTEQAHLAPQIRGILPPALLFAGPDTLRAALPLIHDFPIQGDVSPPLQPPRLAA